MITESEQHYIVIRYPITIQAAVPFNATILSAFLADSENYPATILHLIVAPKTFEVST